MKNQYFGDVGDYGKYGLLRFLASKNIKIAVNWYLTEDDGTNDGKHTTYLKQKVMSQYDEELYNLLRSMILEPEFRPVRDVIDFEAQNAIPEAVYYHELLIAKRSKKYCYDRTMWRKLALEACKDAELVFLDPDNGAREGQLRNTKRDVKYCSTDEIAEYYKRGQNVVYYCSRGRRPQEDWEKTKNMMLGKLPDARIAVITFHKGTQRSYIFVLHEEAFQRYSEYLKEFLKIWDPVFTEDVNPA